MFKLIRMTTVVLVLTGLFVGSIFLSQIYAQAHQIQNNMRIDEQTGVSVAIYNVNTRQYSGTPEQIARQYLLENKTLLGMAKNLSDLELIEVKESPAGHHVGFKQVYQGVPVMRSEMVISINHQNRVSMVINGHKPDISVSTAPSIGKNQALQLAKQAIGAEETDEIFPSRMELMVYEDSVRAFHLAWKVLLFPFEPDGEWLIIVDANSGEILEKFNTVINYVNGTGRVFDPDPGTELRNSTLPDSNDADYPALQPAYDIVALNDLNNAVGGIYKVRGKYAWSENIIDLLDDDDEIVTESDPDDFTYNRSQNGFEEVNIYYFIDKQRRYVGSLGFSPTWDVNFGNTPEAIAFDARGTKERNAYYSPTNEYMYFGVPSSYVDAGEDQNVILHEYGHAFHDALIIGGTDNVSNQSDTRGIGEGIGDYLGVGYRRTTQPSNPFRPNHRGNWFYPTQPTSIRTPENAKYPEPPEGHWGLSRYDKMNVWASTLMDMEYQVATDPAQGTLLGRDITTKLMLTSLSFVTSSSSVVDNVYAIFQADRDILEYNGAHLDVLAGVFDSRGFFYYNSVSGTIASNTIWSGYILVAGDVTVNIGVTLTIDPGTFIFFESGKKLIINGTITTIQSLSNNSINRIIFDRSGSSGTWGPIIFDGSGASNSVLVNVEIKYASDIQCLNGADVTISNSIIENSTQGIYIYNSQPKILNNQIIEPSKNGIYGEASGKSPLIQGNVITKSDSNTQYKQFQGIIFGNSTRPFITYNDISGFYHAVYLGGGTYTYLTDESYLTSNPNNRLKDSRYGLNTGWGSTTIAGKLTYGGMGGYNSVYNNSSRDVQSYQSSTVYAELNYWGGGPANKYVDGSSFLSVVPYLSYDPWAGSSAPMSNQQEVKDLGNFVPGSGSDIVIGSNSNISDLLTGIMLERDGRINEAVLHYKQMVNRNVFVSPALTSLASIANEYDRSDLLSYFNKLVTNRAELKASLLKLLAAMHLHRGNYDETLNLYDEIIMEYGDGYEGVSARLDKFFAVINYGKNITGAANLLLEIELLNITDEELLIRKEFANYLLNGTAKLNKGTASVNNRTNDNGLPQEFALFDNYPNPFNPTTTIEYSIPVASFVELKIYDILGGEVASLVKENKPSGIHSVEFNASNLPSGIYFYRIVSGNFSATKKLILIK